MSTSIVERTRRVIERVVGAGRLPAVVCADDGLADAYLLDSLELVEVVVGCEVEFGIVFSESGDLDPSSLATLGSLAGAIAARLHPTEASA